MSRNADEVLADLEAFTSHIDEALAHVANLRVRRNDAILEGDKLGVSKSKMAMACHITEVAVYGIIKPQKRSVTPIPKRAKPRHGG